MYNSLDEYYQAKKRHEKALMISKKIFGKDPACIVTNYHNLVSVYNPLGEYNQAK